MSKSRTLSYPVSLTTAQLSFLLMLLEAQQLFGTEQPRLFPTDSDTQSQLWQTGEQQLIEAAWMSKEDDTVDINEHLFLLVAALAAADTVIIAQIAVSQHAPRAVTHYISSTAVIEMAYQNDVYQLTVLDSAMVMAARLAHICKLPTTTQATLTFELTQAQIRTMQAATSIGDMATASVPTIAPEAAQLYLHTLQQLQHKASVQIVYIRKNQIVGRDQLGVLVATDNSALIATPVQQQTQYQVADTAVFKQRLLELVAQLQGESNV